MKKPSIVSNLILIFVILSMSACKSNDAKNIRFFVGTYSPADKPGIYSCELDLRSRSIHVLNAVYDIENPSFLALSANKKYLYAVSETNSYDGSESGGVYAYGVNSNDLTLRALNSVSSAGAHPCHLSVHPSGKSLFVANYSGGNIASISIHPDGSLKGTTKSVQHMGSGPVKDRQEKAHAHSAKVTPSGNFVYSGDLGIDKVLGYRVTTQTGELSPLDVGTVSMAPGSGPRHMALHPSKDFLFVINELNSTVTACSFNQHSGEVAVLESLSTLPEGYTETNYCADIHVHPSGNFLYASNRGHNSIAVFSLEWEGLNGAIEMNLVQTIACAGEWPRNFAISQDGGYLMVANQHSDNIALFGIDQADGHLSDLNIMLELPDPVCILFY